MFDHIPQSNLFSWNAILSIYSKLGRLSQMQQIFDLMPFRDGASWNLAILGYANYGSSTNVVGVYKLMLKDTAMNLNQITFSRMLILCSNCQWMDLGRKIHGQILKFGFGSYVFVGCPFLDMNAKLGLIFDAKGYYDEMLEMIIGLIRLRMIEESKRLFHGLKEKDSISWTTMISGLMHNGMEREADDMFREMILARFTMDHFTFGSILIACGSLLALGEGKQIHVYVIRTDHKDNVFVGSALVDMYPKCKSIKSGETVFERMTQKNVVSWTAMLVGYGQNGFSEEAVKIFFEMQRNGFEPNDFTLGSVISSCTNLASLEEGA